jgi:hypothetical protein
MLAFAVRHGMQLARIKTVNCARRNRMKIDQAKRIPQTLGTIFLLLGSTLLTSGCTKNPPVPETTRVEDIKENPAAFVGKTVVVSGEVEQVYGPRAFQLGGTDFFDSEIRVLTAQPLKESVRRRADQPFIKDDIALVTGTVRNVVVADVERELSFDLDPTYEVEFENRPAIIASSVLISPRGQEASSATVSTTQQTDLQAILRSPNQATLAGSPVSLQRAQVESVIGDQSFWIGSASGRIFVTFAEIPTPGKPKEGQVAIRAGQTVNLSGVIRSMPTLSDEWLKQNQVDSKTAESLKQQAIYIHASEVSVVESAG